MTRPIVKTAMALVLAGMCLGAGNRAALGSASVAGDAFKGSRVPANDAFYHFKVKAGGYLNLADGTVTFAGHATHLGQFTATGNYNPSEGTMLGKLSLTNGDSVAWFLTFIPPLPGQNNARMDVGPGTGPFAGTYAFAGGVFAPDEDSFFTLELEGRIWFNQEPPCLAAPCLDVQHE